jgi:hypothetical protein
MTKPIQIQDIKTKDEAIDYIDAERWKHGYECPRCQCQKGYRHKKRKLIECARCGKQTSPTANTIFHGTRKPLLLLWLLDLISRGCNLSTSAISKLYDTGYATVWHNTNVARLALRSLGTLQRSFIQCDSLKAALIKRAKGDRIARSQPDLLFRDEASEELIKCAIGFILLIFTGVSRKYAQAYITQFELFLKKETRTLSHLLDTAFSSGISHKELRHYKSPPAVLIDARSYVAV